MQISSSPAPLFLALDAGGTSTRASFLDASGNCLGYGRSGPGNPVSSGFDRALSSLTSAVQQALKPLENRPFRWAGATLAMAGGTTKLPREALSKAFESLGLQGKLMIDSDLLATFYSGTYHRNGYALVAGTGAVCARIRNYQLERVVDGVGWLLGDVGSGFWLGRRAVRAVAAELDGRAQRTELTGLLLSRLNIAVSPDHHEGRPVALQSLIQAVYELRPIELASFAVLVFEAAKLADPVAISLLQETGVALAHSLATARTAEVTGPVVLGGSLLSAGSIIDRELSGQLAGQRALRVPDGLAGAALLALRHAGLPVDEEKFDRIAQSLGELRG